MLDAASVLSDRVFAGALMVASFGFAGLFSYVSTSSVLLQEVYGLTPLQYSLCFAANAAGMTAMGMLNARLVGRFGPDRLAPGFRGRQAAAA